MEKEEPKIQASKPEWINDDERITINENFGELSYSGNLHEFIIGSKTYNLEEIEQNQNKLNQIINEVVDCNFKNITVVNAYERIAKIVSNKDTKELK